MTYKYTDVYYHDTSQYTVTYSTLTYTIVCHGDDQMKSNTNHARNTYAECLCEKESLMTVFTKVMALLPMNSDF